MEPSLLNLVYARCWQSSQHEIITYMDETALGELLRIGEIDHDDLISTLSSIFPRGRTDGDRKVHYQTQEEETAVTLEYAKKGNLIKATPGPALTEDVVTKLSVAVEQALTLGEPVVWREVFFSALPVDAWWRYQDEWQITPAPPEAPRPPAVIGEHPFILELRVEKHPDMMIYFRHRAKRLRELQLILAIALRGRITRFTERSVSQFDWKYIHPVLDGAEWRSDCLQNGYHIPGFNAQLDSFTSIETLKSIKVVPDEEYYARVGIGVGDSLEIPEILEPVLEAFEKASPTYRDRFLRACYWFDRGDEVWSLSASLSYLALCNAIEVLLGHGEADPCPTCGKDRAPGPTQRFAGLVSEYASPLPKAQQRELYELRSSLTHGHTLLDLDLPGAFGGLVPKQIEQRHTHEIGRNIARAAIINFILKASTN